MAAKCAICMHLLREMCFGDSDPVVCTLYERYATDADLPSDRVMELTQEHVGMARIIQARDQLRRDGILPPAQA